MSKRRRMPNLLNRNLKDRHIASASREDNGQMLEAIKRNEPGAIDTIIERNIPLVFVMVGAYLRSKPVCKHLRDDLVSEGCLALTRAVHRLAAHDEDVKKYNPTGYLNISIQRAIYALSKVDCTIHVPRDCDAKRRSIIPLCEGFRIKDLLENSSAIADLWELIDDLCQDADERTVITMRRQGFCDSEIGEALCLSQETVRRRRKRLYRRFLEETGLPEESPTHNASFR